MPFRYRILEIEIYQCKYMRFPLQDGERLYARSDFVRLESVYDVAYDIS